MAIENITLNIIPTGDTPSIHVAQFDVDRPFTVTLKEGTDDFTPTGYTIELQVRKVDNTIVTTATASVLGNVVTFNTTEQMTACSGTNLAELQLTKDSQTFATLHFYLVVQRDVLAGGVTSKSDIDNLTEQIAEIVPGVIGDDYYTKEEVDEIIEDIPTFDPTNYYDKSETDALLDDKADASDLPDMTNYYNKSQTDALLNDKADVSDLPDMTDYYTKSEVDTKITDLYQIKTASGSIVHITDGGNAIPVKSLVSQIVAVESGSGEKTPANPYIITGFSSGVVSVNSNTYTFVFGQTVYSGYFNNKGDLVVTHKEIDLSSLSWSATTLGSQNVWRTSLPNDCKGYADNFVPTNIWCEQYEPNSVDNMYTGYSGISLRTSGSYIYCSRTDLNEPQGKLIAELITPTSLTITGQKILTEKVCDISSDTGDIEIEYFTEKSDGIAELIKAFM